MDKLILQAVQTAEAIGMPLSQTKKIAFDSLHGYDLKELSQFADLKGLEKLVKSSAKTVLTNRDQALYLKPIVMKDNVFVVLAKTTDDNLICCRMGDDYRTMITPAVPNLKLATDEQVSEPSFVEYYNDLLDRLELAQSLSSLLPSMVLDRCDETTKWEIGVDSLPFKEIVYDKSISLSWGFSFYKVVFAKNDDERVLPCMLLKESKELGLLKQV